jgi:hypothetical protein
MNEFQRTSRTTRQIARCTGIALTSIALGGIGIAHAQDKFPSRPVRIIVAFAPGGGTDIIARSIAAKLTTRYQQQFIVDNRPGGGGNVGMEIAARAVPDGYTLLAVSSSYAANAVMRKTAYDPITGFDPVSLLSRQAVVLLAHPSVPVTSVKDLIALAKAKPGTLTYGSSGSGGIQHLATELFKSMAQVDIVHVPYKGTGSRAERPDGRADQLEHVVDHRRSASCALGQAEGIGREQRNAFQRRTGHPHARRSRGCPATPTTAGIASWRRRRRRAMCARP